MLTADASLDLRANPDQDAQGIVIEAHLDRGRGPVATVLVQRGTLRVGDSIVAGAGLRPGAGDARRARRQHRGSRPGVVRRWCSVSPPCRVPARTFIVVDDDRMARQIAEKRESRERAAMQAKRRVRRTLEDFMASMEKGESQELNLILKGDVSGSVEALEDALAKIDVGDDVSMRVIDRGVGAITETNVDLAAASDAIIIGFNVRPQGKATELADREGVEIRYYSVIYQAIEEIEAALKGMLKPEFEESTLGQAEIRAIFRSSKHRQHRGLHGHQRRHPPQREGARASATARSWPTTSTSPRCKREKDDATEVREGFECGLVLRNFQDIKEGDVVEAFEMKEIPRA